MSPSEMIAVIAAFERGETIEASVMPLDDMLPMENAQGQKFAMKFNPEHQQHGWIFYDNHGQWVTLRLALPHEIERAKAIIEMRQVLAGIPCKAG